MSNTKDFSVHNLTKCQLIYCPPLHHHSPPPSSDTHVENMQPSLMIKSKWRNAGALLKAATGPPAHKTHTNTQHAVPLHYASGFHIVPASSGGKMVTGARRWNTYSHLMPEQSWDSSRAVSTPRGRTWEPLLMVGQWLRFAQDTNTKGCGAALARAQQPTLIATPGRTTI